MLEALRMRRGTYLINFIASLMYALPAYFNATFLISRGFPEDTVGIVYAGGFACGIGALILAPSLLKKFGNYRLFVTLAACTGLATLLLPFLVTLETIVLVFTGIIACTLILYFLLDMFLEGLMRDEFTTGKARGLFITVASISVVSAPLIGGFLLAEERFEYLYIAVAVLSIVLIAATTLFLKHFRDPQYVSLRIPNLIQLIRANGDLRNIYITQFLLYFFYATMIIYTPVYIHQHLGMPLGEMGIVFAIMLIPFILLEMPLGYLEDSRWGEKEVLGIGFAIIAVATAVLALISVPSVILWAIMLFITRIGAAMIEVSNESYFFKHVNGNDASVVSAFRMLYPIAYVVAPFLGSIFLLFMPLNLIFVALAIILVAGIPTALALNDTR